MFSPPLTPPAYSVQRRCEQRALSFAAAGDKSLLRLVPRHIVERRAPVAALVSDTPVSAAAHVRDEAAGLVGVAIDGCERRLQLRPVLGVRQVLEDVQMRIAAGPIVGGVSHPDVGEASRAGDAGRRRGF
jgi:hypothetical protein